MNLSHIIFLFCEYVIVAQLEYKNNFYTLRRMNSNFYMSASNEMLHLIDVHLASKLQVIALKTVRIDPTILKCLPAKNYKV